HRVEGAVAVVHVAARVGGGAAVVAHQPERARGHLDVELVARRVVVGIEVGRLVERLAVDRDAPLGVAALDPVAADADHALDGVFAVPAFEHHDVAASGRPGELVDEHPVVDVQGVLHRLRGDVERPDHERLQQQRDADARDQQKDGLPKGALFLLLQGLRLLGAGHQRFLPSQRRRTRIRGTASANPDTSGAAPVSAWSAGCANVSGMGIVVARENGQTMTKARPMTWLSGMAPPPGSPVWERESMETWRWSPITQR